MKYVLDASVAIRWFIDESRHARADETLAAVLSRPGDFAVPELFAYEVMALLYRHHPDPPTVLREDIEPILRCGILRYPMTPSIVERANRFISVGLTGYDAVYVALAEELEARWLTFDRKAHELLAPFDLSLDMWAIDGLEPARHTDRARR